MKIRISQTLVMNTFLVAIATAISIWSIPYAINSKHEDFRTFIGIGFVFIDFIVIMAFSGIFLINFYDGDIHLFDDFEINLFQKKDKKDVLDLTSEMLDAERKGDNQRANMLHDKIKSILK